MIKEFIKKIKEYDTIIIHRHSRPDGDAMGSQLGLKKSIQKTFPDKNVYAVGDINQRLTFMGDVDTIVDDTYKNALVIICDTACSYMISDERYKLAKEIFIVDHHTNKSDVEENNLIIEPERCACAELIADILFENKFVVDSEVAALLYTGIVTDSGRFQFSCSPRVFSIASKLIETGFDPQEIYNNLYVESLEKRKLTAVFTERFKLTEGNVAYLINTKEDLEKYNLSFNDCSRGMIGVMAGIEGINIWANFTFDESKGKVGCEFRSRGISIVDIAKKWGGGGHDMACGATIDSFDMVNDILHDFDERMKEIKC